MIVFVTVFDLFKAVEFLKAKLFSLVNLKFLSSIPRYKLSISWLWLLHPPPLNPPNNQQQHNNQHQEHWKLRILLGRLCHCVVYNVNSFTISTWLFEMFTPPSSSITPLSISSRQFALVRNKTRNGTMDVIRHPPEHLSRLLQHHGIVV